jgi:DNA (cytosine-5)-methyltransferase 1
MGEGLDSRLTLIDLFSGCGGISRGFAHAGFQSLLGLDVDDDSLATYQLNHEGARILNADIRQIDRSILASDLGLAKEELDCLAGGPPCQSFSKNVPRKERFFDDPRNHLYRWFMDFVEGLLPKVVLIENVAELAGAHNGYVREQILERLDALGYSVIWKRLLAADYGVPQMRRRVFFLASRIGDKHLRFPEPTHSTPEDPAVSLLPLQAHVTVREAIGDLPRLNAGEGTEPSPYASNSEGRYQRMMRNGNKAVYDHVARPLASTQLARLQAIRPGQRASSLPRHLRPRSSYGGAYARLAWDQPALTITTWVFHPGSGRFGHPEDDRTITMREAARLQSFDDDFRFIGSYNSKARQIGNAVPPLLAQRLGAILAEQIAA